MPVILLLAYFSLSTIYRAVFTLGWDGCGEDQWLPAMAEDVSLCIKATLRAEVIPELLRTDERLNQPQWRVWALKKPVAKQQLLIIYKCHKSFWGGQHVLQSVENCSSQKNKLDMSTHSLSMNSWGLWPHHALTTLFKKWCGVVTGH